MSSASDYTEINILAAVLRGTAFPAPSGAYVALFTADPTDAGSGAEVDTANWPAYARQDAAAGAAIATGWSAPADASGKRQSTNAKKLTFGKNLGSDVVVSHFGIMDAASSGNLLYHKALVASKTIGLNDDLSFGIGALKVDLTGFSNYVMDNVLNTTLRGVAFPLPSAVYVAAFKTDPTPAGTGTEVNTTEWPAYARIDAADGGAISTGWTAPADGAGGRKESTNAKQLVYAANDGAGTVAVTHWALFDAVTSGNLLIPDALDTAKDVEVGDELGFDIGDLLAAAA